MSSNGTCLRAIFVGVAFACAQPSRPLVQNSDSVVSGERGAAPPRTATAKLSLPATAPALEPWVKPCAAALTEGYAKLKHLTATRGAIPIEARANAVILQFEPDKTLVVDHSVDGSVRRWHWQAQDSPVITDERERGTLHARFTFAQEARVPDELGHAADDCLAFGGEPAFDTDAADGVVCEDAGISLLPLGRDVLVIGRDIRRVIDGETGRVSERKFELPPDYPKDPSFEFHPILADCGDGELVLYHSWGPGLMYDGTQAPETGLWRRDGNGTWSAEQTFNGRFIGCGPTWTLLAKAVTPDRIEGASAYGHEHVWTVEAVGNYPYPIPQLSKGSGRCPHALSPVSWVGFASGDVFAAGPGCGASSTVNVSHWRKGSPVPRLFNVSGSHKMLGLWSAIFESATGVSVRMTDVNPNKSRTWLARFDGTHWRRPIVEPDDNDSLLGIAPKGRKGQRWRYISSMVETASGDLWMTASEHQTDCGNCFMYDALLRVRKEARAQARLKQQ